MPMPPIPRRPLLALAVVALASATLPAAPQSGTNLERPPTWQARYDDARAGARGLVVMRPGWHINPGPAGIFWDPSRFAAGNYAVTSTVFLFPAGGGDPPAQVDAPYGVVLAGRDLTGPNAAYVGFLLRNDGQFRVAWHRGSRVTDLVPWTEHPAIAMWKDGDEGTARNVQMVDATADVVTFWINEEEVAAVPRPELPLEGIVGYRAGDRLSLHIRDLTIGPNRQ